MTMSTVVAVPLHEGAGVKFKTIESLVAGVPVVTTTVGAEGIQPVSLFHAVTDDATKFADALSEALTSPHAAQARANRAQEVIAQRYGRAGFAAKVAGVYGEVGSIAST
jgi:glycosyltransferase involved in cell wall biosynthesis